MDAGAFYTTQSAITDPGSMATHLTDLPDDVPTLRRLVSGLVIHYRADDPLAHGIPEERLREIDTRTAEAMLRRLFELDPRPLTEERPPEKRLVRCCRDFTVLFLALARHQGIPAHGRVGFASYFVPGFNVDHEVAEMWDADAAAWRLVDANLGERHIDPSDGATLDPMHLPRDRFLVAGAAWRACRAGTADPARFLVDPYLDLDALRGWPYLRHNVIHDLAALTKREMVLWDSWGVLEDQHPADTGDRLCDRIAAVIGSENPPLSAVRGLYQGEPDVQVPAIVTSYDPLGGPPREVAVAV